MKFAAAVAIAYLTLVAPCSYAQGSGGSIVNIEDGTVRECVDVSKNTVSIMVVSLQAARTDTFWKKSKALGAKFDVSISNNKGQVLTFPRATQLSARSYTGDVGVIPARISIMSKYALSADRNAYSTIGLKFYLIDLVEKSDTANALQTLIKFSKNLPLPPNPYSAGLELFGNFVDQIVDQNIANAEEKLPVAELQFDLAGTTADAKRCPSSALRTGAIGVIFSYPGTGEDVLDLDKADDYCFTFSATTSRVHMSRRKTDGTKACDEKATSRPIRNPLVAMIVNPFSLDAANAEPPSVLPQRAAFDVWSIAPKSAKDWPTLPNSVIDNTLKNNAYTLAANQSPDSQEQIEKLWQLQKSGSAPSFLATTTIKYEDFAADNVRSAGLDLQSVAGYSNLKSKISTYKKGNAPRIIEIETAVALSRCAVVGVPANECF